jgi:FtsP/CotA-like multicopper oxidase with cupredoxin domain
MVLTRGTPVAVEVVNRLSEPTAIHWHGIELESYDDGVPDFGGSTGSITPRVPPGGTFTARFTPSRAGTFMYHTHWHNAQQLAGGIYGPLIVTEPGDSYDPSTDHIVVMGLDGMLRQLPDEPFAINGYAEPPPLELKAGVRNRIRFINITANNVGFAVQLSNGFDPFRWTLVAKDGDSAPTSSRTERPARQSIAVGETYDFELAPMRPGEFPNLWMEVRRGTGEQLFQWPVIVRRP